MLRVVAPAWPPPSVGVVARHVPGVATLSPLLGVLPPLGAAWCDAMVAWGEAVNMGRNARTLPCRAQRTTTFRPARTAQKHTHTHTRRGGSGGTTVSNAAPLVTHTTAPVLHAPPRPCRVPHTPSPFRRLYASLSDTTTHGLDGVVVWWARGLGHHKRGKIDIRTPGRNRARFFGFTNPVTREHKNWKSHQLILFVITICWVVCLRYLGPLEAGTKLSRAAAAEAVAWKLCAGGATRPGAALQGMVSNASDWHGNPWLAARAVHTAYSIHDPPPPTCTARVCHATRTLLVHSVCGPCKHPHRACRVAVSLVLRAASGVSTTPRAPGLQGA